MSKFVITFRIKDDANYSTRWATVQEKIKSLVGSSYWSQTTSFYIVDYNGSAAQLDNEIYFGSGLHDQDLMVVINLSIKTDYAIRGPYSDKDIDILLKNR